MELPGCEGSAFSFLPRSYVPPQTQKPTKPPTRLSNFEPPDALQTPHKPPQTSSCSLQPPESRWELAAERFALKDPPPPSSGRVEWRARILKQVLVLVLLSPGPTALPPAAALWAQFSFLFAVRFSSFFGFDFQPLLNTLFLVFDVQNPPKTLPKTLPKSMQNRIFSRSA